jgi:hypothetical protein
MADAVLRLLLRSHADAGVGDRELSRPLATLRARNLLGLAAKASPFSTSRKP